MVETILANPGYVPTIVTTWVAICAVVNFLARLTGSDGSASDPNIFELAFVVLLLAELALFHPHEAETLQGLDQRHDGPVLA